jgi:uncharacterized membrane protein
VSATAVPTTVRKAVPGTPHPLLRWSATVLVGASWVSAGAFALYIFAFYLGAIRSQHMARWNDNLPGLYDKANVEAQAAIGIHMAAGAAVLLLGPVQLIGAVRRRWPALHRWLGRVYVIASAAAGVGGLVFIFAKGTIGGAPMNVGFGLYGALMLIASIEAWRHALAGRFDVHRAWAIRLFALAVGSWLYRMDYGFWLIGMNRIGHNEHFTGPFDVVMAYFFYLPNLAVAELFLRGQRMAQNRALRVTAICVLNLASLVVVVGTYYFARFYWGPAIMDAVTGRG